MSNRKTYRIKAVGQSFEYEETFIQEDDVASLIENLLIGNDLRRITLTEMEVVE